MLAVNVMPASFLNIFFANACLTTCLTGGTAADWPWIGRALELWGAPSEFWSGAAWTEELKTFDREGLGLEKGGTKGVREGWETVVVPAGTGGAIGSRSDSEAEVMKVLTEVCGVGPELLPPVGAWPEGEVAASWWERPPPWDDVLPV